MCIRDSQLNAQINSKKELFNKTQGVVEYLNTIGVKLPEADAPAEETTTAPTEVVK